MDKRGVLDHAIRHVTTLSAVLAMISLAALVFLFIAILLLRPLGIAIPSADEFAGILLAGTLALGLGAAVGYDDHLEVRFLVNSLPPRPRFLLAVLAIIASILVVGALLAGVGELWLGSFRRGTTMIGGLGIPRAVPIGVIFVGMALFEIALVLKLLRFLGGATSPAADDAKW